MERLVMGMAGSLKYASARVAPAGLGAAPKYVAHRHARHGATGVDLHTGPRRLLRVGHFALILRHGPVVRCSIVRASDRRAPAIRSPSDLARDEGISGARGHGDHSGLRDEVAVS